MTKSEKLFGTTKSPNYKDIVCKLLNDYKTLGCNMSLKIHLFDSHLHFFLDNLGAISDEHEESFLEDITAMEKGK